LAAASASASAAAVAVPGAAKALLDERYAKPNLGSMAGILAAVERGEIDIGYAQFLRVRSIANAAAETAGRELAVYVGRLIGTLDAPMLHRAVFGSAPPPLQHVFRLLCAGPMRRHLASVFSRAGVGVAKIATRWLAQLLAAWRMLAVLPRPEGRPRDRPRGNREERRVVR
jgi:hypothetical protein